MRVELINVEYGDCTVFVGSKNEILMTDCGSSNNKLRSPEMDILDVFSYVENRYYNSPQKIFILTHYHRDHFRGFKWIYKRDSRYFNKILLPYIPKSSDGTSPILKYALLSSLIGNNRTDFVGDNISILNIFYFLLENLDRVAIISKGDKFVFDSEVYTILSPAKNFPLNHKLTEIISCATDLLEDEINFLIEEFISTFYRLLDGFSIRGCEENKSLAIKLRENLDNILRCYSKNEEDIDNIINSMTAKEIYSHEINDISIVYHSKEILMTGDASGDVGELIYNQLNSCYSAVKAPHHGTESCYWNVFKNIGIDNFLISCGEYQDYQKVGKAYLSHEIINHCTNNSACAYFKEYKNCCNKLKICHGIADLCLKCYANRSVEALGACKIYVIAPAKGRSCHC